MGIGIGYGMNDEPNLGEQWKQGLAQKEALKDDHLQREAVEWYESIVAKIPSAMAAAIRAGESQVEVGEFRSGEILSGKGEYYPTADQLTGGAALLYAYCEKQGLRLFIGGDFKISGEWRAPFEVIIRVKV